MKTKAKNRPTPKHPAPTSSNIDDEPVTYQKPPRKPPVSNKKARGPLASTKVMRRASFSGKLHRGHVVDAATEFATTCQVKAECGACKYINTNYATSLRTKFEAGVQTLKDSGAIHAAQILDPFPSPTPLAYRSYFKLAVRPAPPSRPQVTSTTNGQPRFAIGLFEPGTHKVSINMTDCPVQTRPLNSLLRDLQTEIESSTLQPYDEKSKTGDVRYIAARSSHLTGEIMLTFVVNAPQKFELIRLVNRLRRLGHKINSAHMNVNKGEGNAIFGAETILLAGNTGLRERICDLDIEISPLAFFQVNPWQASNLYRRVETHAGRSTAGETAWDLYTGTGQIALMLARAGFRTLGIEEIAAATTDATRNAQRNKLADSVEFLAAKVEDSEASVPTWATKPKVIVVNPSRRGLHEDARSHLSHVLRQNPDVKLIYVSCEVQTLARDLKALTASGHKVRQIEAFDMFAQTEKLEWLAVLTG